MFRPGDEQQPAVPQIPGFEDMRRIGSGGSAVVYRARQVVMDRPVAIKVFTERIDDSRARKQFTDECAALGALSGIDGIVTIYLTGFTTDGRVYLVMALYEDSLQNRLHRPGGLPVEDIARIGGSVAVTLHHIHVAGRVHGDITPSNILLSTSGSAVLSDFGLSVAHDSHGGQDAATWEHAAPELWQGVREPKVDVYGLGSTLFTAVTGTPPVPREPGEPLALYGARVRNARPRPLDGSRLPGGMAAVLNAMLAERPPDRPDPLEIATALAEFAGTGTAPRATSAAEAGAGAPTTTRRPGVSEAWSPSAAPAPSTTVRPGASEPAPERRAASRSTWWLAGGAVVLAVLVAVGVVLLLNRGDGTPGPAHRPEPTASQPSSPGTPPVETSRISLDTPVDNGSTVELSWTGPDGWDYGVVVAIEGDPGQPDVELVYDRTSYTVEIEPDRRYCFQVQGTPDGKTAAVSNAVGIRGAECENR